VISLRRTLMLPFSALGMAVIGVLSDLGSPKLAYLFGFTAIIMALPIYLKIGDDGDD